MANKAKLEELRQAVLGNQRGREVEVTPEGQVVLDSGETSQSSETASEKEETGRPKVSKMSPHTFARV